MPAVRHKFGFTLVEVTMVTAILSVVLLLATTVWIRTLDFWDSQRSYVTVTTGLRTAAYTMSRELATAVTADRPSLVPPVAGAELAEEPHTTITFQKPLTTDETVWSNPIQIRHRNEDTNGNLKLDSGEDTDGNGIVDRVVERLEDLNGNGSFDDPGEKTILGRDIDTMTLELEGTDLTVTLTARAGLGRVGREYDHTESFNVNLLP